MEMITKFSIQNANTLLKAVWAHIENVVMSSLQSIRITSNIIAYTNQNDVTVSDKTTYHIIVSLFLYCKQWFPKNWI